MRLVRRLRTQVGLSLSKKAAPQFDVGGLVFYDVVNGHGHGVGNGDYGLLLAAPGRDAAKLGSVPASAIITSATRQLMPGIPSRRSIWSLSFFSRFSM